MLAAGDSNDTFVFIEHRQFIKPGHGTGKTAIKTGDRLNEREMRVLIDQLFATSMPYVCPHGRPIIVKIPLYELDRRFGRT